jgi:hypothetical protein
MKVLLSLKKNSLINTPIPNSWILSREAHLTIPKIENLLTITMLKIEKVTSSMRQMIYSTI